MQNQALPVPTNFTKRSEGAEAAEVPRADPTRHERLSDRGVKSPIEGVTVQVLLP